MKNNSVGLEHIGRLPPLRLWVPSSTRGRQWSCPLTDSADPTIAPMLPPADVSEGQHDSLQAGGTQDIGGFEAFMPRGGVLDARDHYIPLGEHC